MIRHNIRNVAFISAGIVSVLAVGFFALIFAQEEKVIPDHSSLEFCQPCHAEKHSMWETSNHAKAIRQIAGFDPSVSDCGGCHSTIGSEAKSQNTTVDSIGEESFHKISCLACHARQETEYDHRIVMDPGKLCDVCHTQRAVFWGKGAKGIEDSRIYHSGIALLFSFGSCG